MARLPSDSFIPQSSQFEVLVMIDKIVSPLENANEADKKTRTVQNIPFILSFTQQPKTHKELKRIPNREIIYQIFELESCNNLDVKASYVTVRYVLFNSEQ